MNKLDLIQLYLFGQAQDHSTRKEIEKQIKKYNRNNKRDKLLISDVIEYMYPKFYQNLLLTRPGVTIENNYSVYLSSIKFSDASGFHGLSERLIYLDIYNFYLVNSPLTIFVPTHAVGTLEFQLDPSSHFRYPNMISTTNPTLKLREYTLRAFNYMEKR